MSDPFSFPLCHLSALVALFLLSPSKSFTLFTTSIPTVFVSSAATSGVFRDAHRDCEGKKTRADTVQRPARTEKNLCDNHIDKLLTVLCICVRSHASYAPFNTV